jgi:hypothetical protein
MLHSSPSITGLTTRNRRGGSMINRRLSTILIIKYIDFQVTIFNLQGAMSINMI